MRIVSLVLILLLLFSLTGCWNAREINELAFVLCIALDKAENGFKVTAQIAKPETYSKTPSGGAGAVTGKEKPFWVVTSTGKTIFEAVRNMATVSSRRIFWPHIRVIIIGEELAKSNILEIFDFFSRNPELRLRTWITITPGEAGKILEVVPLMEKDPALNIERIIYKTNLSGVAYSIMLKDFLEDYLDPYKNPVASRIVLTTVNSEPTVMLEGASVFSGNKLKGWLNKKETRGLLWVRNKIKGSIRVVNCPYDGLPITLEIKKGKTSIQSNIKDGIPYYTIKANVSGNITEKACATDYTDLQARSDLEKVLASAVREDILSAVTAARNYNSDFLDFSSTLRRQHKNEWHQISANWPQLFSSAKVKVQVKAEIPQASLMARPLAANKGPAANPH